MQFNPAITYVQHSRPEVVIKWPPIGRSVHRPHLRRPIKNNLRSI